MDSRTKAILEEVGCRSEEGRRHAVREIARSFQQSAREQPSHDYWVQLWSELNDKVTSRLLAACTRRARCMCTCMHTACTLHVHVHTMRTAYALRARVAACTACTTCAPALALRCMQVSALVNSSAVHEQLGGLLLVQELIPLECEDNASKITSFANFVRLPLGASADGPVLQSASRALGMLAQAGGNEAVEPELKRALQRLKLSNRLESAVLVIRELAVHAPTLLYVHVADVIDNLWPAIKHPAMSVREGAAAALHAALELVAARSNGTPRVLGGGSCAGEGSAGRWYQLCFDEAKGGFELGTAESIHGTLLTTAEAAFLSGRGSIILCDRDCHPTCQVRCSQRPSCWGPPGPSSIPSRSRSSSTSRGGSATTATR